MFGGKNKIIKKKKEWIFYVRQCDFGDMATIRHEGTKRLPLSDKYSY